MADPDALDPSASDPAAQDPSGPAPPSPWAAIDLNKPGWGDDSIANKPVQFWGLDGLSPDLEKNLYNAMTAHSLGQDPATVDPGARPFMNLMGLMSSAHADLGPGVFGDDLGGSAMQPQPPPPPGPPAMGLDYLSSTEQPRASDQADQDPSSDGDVDIPASQPVAPPDLSTAIPSIGVTAPEKTLRSSDLTGPQTLTGLPIGGKNVKPQFDGAITDRVNQFFKGLNNQGVQIKLVDGFRTRQDQDIQHQLGRGASPGSGLHEAGLAFDVNWKQLNPSQQSATLNAASDAGLQWGGKFRKTDSVHFYVDPFKDLSERQAYIRNLQAGASGR